MLAGLAGLALTSTLNLTQLMNWLVRRLTELEMNMNSVERILDYADVPREVDTTKPAVRCVTDAPRSATDACSKQGIGAALLCGALVVLMCKRLTLASLLPWTATSVRSNRRYFKHRKGTECI